MRGHISAGLALALTGSLLAALPSAGQTSQRGTTPAGACEVRVMAWPDGADNGTVTDIEVVPGMGTVYYGSYVAPDATWGMARRAVVWHGVDAQPVQVGPTGTLWDIAFELTPNGKVNGQSVVDDTGLQRAWVQDLRTGLLTWVETGGAETFRVRRINERGDAVGTLGREDWQAEATIWWPGVTRPGRPLPSGEVGYAEGWGINNLRAAVGFLDHHVAQFDAVVPYGVMWDKHGSATPLASNPGVEGDSLARVLNDAGQAAGVAWYGSWFDGHYEAARWPSPGAIEPLGLLPGGGYSDVFGQSEDGWAVGVAEHLDPQAADGYVDHSVLWAEDPGTVRVLPSPYAVEHSLDDWQEWVGGPAHGVHTGLDQVGTRAQDGWHEDGSVRYAPTVYVNASRCGEAVATTHTAPWEDPVDGVSLSTMSWEAPASRTATNSPRRPETHRNDVVRERVLSED